MSTRSIIARVGQNEGEFRGVYVHWDGSPTTRGPLIWQIIREEFGGNLKAALVALIDKHKAGWSSIAEPRECYCHPTPPRKPESANIFTHEHVINGDTDIEWLFIFDEKRNRLCVRDVSNDAEFLVELEDAKPDWETIECGGETENWARCRHYAWAHKMLPRTSNLSTRTYLGHQPLEFHDAVGFIIEGKRYSATGSGRSSHYYGGNGFPPNSWIASLKARNGKRIDVAVAKITDDGYVPLPGIVWIFPPTKNNPTETLTSGSIQCE